MKSNERSIAVFHIKLLFSEVDKNEKWKWFEIELIVFEGRQSVKKFNELCLRIQYNPFGNVHSNANEIPCKCSIHFCGKHSFSV